MISAIVHTYNEEKNIERCLSSLSWVDEIVVIDMGSTDKTREKASNFKVKFYSHPYTGFVEPARNFGIEKARGSWILIVDADEEIPRKLADYLITRTREAGDYFRIPRKNIIFGKWIRYTGWWPDCQIRFFKKGKVQWTDKIHGVPLTKGVGFDIKPEEDLSIIHYNYQTLEQFIDRLNRYTSVSAKELFLNNARFKLEDLFRIPMREFVNRFFLGEGYRDGLHGLALSFLQAISEAVVYLKLWELENFKEKSVSYSEIKKLADHSYHEYKYWHVTKRIEESKNIVEKALLKFKRKLTKYG